MTIYNAIRLENENKKMPLKEVFSQRFGTLGSDVCGICTHRKHVVTIDEEVEVEMKGDRCGVAYCPFKGCDGFMVMANFKDIKSDFKLS